jgi:hypothetical protein
MYSVWSLVETRVWSLVMSRIRARDHVEDSIWTRIRGNIRDRVGSSLEKPQLIPIGVLRSALGSVKDAL